jgi:hypothetical protein
MVSYLAEKMVVMKVLYLVEMMAEQTADVKADVMVGEMVERSGKESRN